jgi:hypothetical protein
VQELVSLYGEDVANEWSSKWPPYRIGEKERSTEPTRETTVEPVDKETEVEDVDGESAKADS